jgi:hypothetical protein
MRKIITFIIAAVTLGACSGPDFKTDDRIQGTQTEKTDWVYDSTVGKPVQKEEVSYMISPTLQQSFYYASKRDDRTLHLILSVACLVVFLFAFFAKILDPTTSYTPAFLANNYIANLLKFLALAFSAYFFLGNPVGVRWNNDKWVPKQTYDKAIKESGSTRPIWDSLEANCRIVDGPYGCYKK